MIVARRAVPRAAPRYCRRVPTPQPELDPVAVAAAAHPSGTAVRDAATTVTWAELDERVATTAAHLRDRGASTGTRVAVVARPGLDLVTTVHACIRVGAAVVPLSPRAPSQEIDQQITDCDPIVVLRDDADLASIAAQPHAAPVGPQTVTEDQDVCVIYTSGSTGTPKGVRLTLGNHRASAAGCAASLGGFDPGDVWLVALGLHRIGGFAVLLRSALYGFAIDVLPRFDEDAVIGAFGRGATLASFVPAMVVRTMDRGGASALQRARALLLGGAPAPAPAVATWAAAGLRVCPSYGMSETCSQVATVPPGEAATYAGTAGFVHPFAEVEVAHDGEIVVSGPVVAPGYVGRGGALADGRFHTGDIGRFDDRGALVVTGRRDLTINTGGEKVQPEEVEAVLASHPSVRDAAVRGVPDATYGEVVEALVVVTDRTAASALKEWCRERLAPHKLPRRFTFVDALPRSEDGKLLRTDLS